MTQNKDPMSLENLPQYLKAQRENVNSGGAPVVGMGQIVAPKKRLRWAERLVFAAIMFVALGVGGMITYDVMTPQQFTVIMSSDNDINAIPTIVSESGGEVIAVKQNPDFSYEVKVSTHKSKRSFLDWLRNNKDVKKAELED